MRGTTMKFIAMIAALISIATSARGEVYEYTVAVADNVSATGVMYSEAGSECVNGTLVIDGEERDVSGYWSGLGMADVYDENKKLYLLEVQ